MANTDDLLLCQRKGSEVSLYLNYGDDPSTAGGSDCSTQAWVFHKGIIGDLNCGEVEDSEELSTRDPLMLVKQYTESKIDVSIEGEQVMDSQYNGCLFINSMRSGGHARDVMILSGYIDEVGSVGWRGKFRNLDRSFTGPETGASKQTLMLKPAACIKAGCRVRPVRVAVAGAIISYSPEAFVAPSAPTTTSTTTAGP